jgi:hypothetical protein
MLLASCAARKTISRNGRIRGIETMLPANRQLLGLGTCVVAVLFLLLIWSLLANELWEGWASKPIDQLPTLFWVLYLSSVVVATIILVEITILGLKNNISNMWMSVARDAFLLLFGVSLAINNWIMPVWTSGRLLGLSFGVFSLYMGALGLALAYFAKRRTTA